jgi:Glyoxalase-like domain
MTGGAAQRRQHRQVLVQNRAMRREPQLYLRGEVVVVIDCSQLDRSAEFWCSALGHVRDGVATGQYQSLHPANGTGIEILLQQVPDGKLSKNRLHLDLRTRDLGPEMQRLIGLGAPVVTAQPVMEDGWRWHVLGDPDGNELCVLEPPARYWQD